MPVGAFRRKEQGSLKDECLKSRAVFGLNRPAWVKDQNSITGRVTIPVVLVYS